MPRTKRKAVISADAEHLAAVERLVRSRRYRTLSEFVRAAMADKLDRLARAQLAERVGRYCEAGYASEDVDLIAAQAFRVGRRRAKG